MSAGRRGPVPLKHPINVLIGKDDNAVVPPAVEDPFDVKRNLGDSMTATSLSRLRAEFTRANCHCKNGGSLSQLLEPWVPPEQEEAESQKN